MQARARRRHRRHPGHAGQLQHRHALASRPRAVVERNGISAAQLAVLHLAVGRFQRRAARPQPGQGRLGHEGRAAEIGNRPRRAPGARRRAVGQYLSITSPSCTNTPTARKLFCPVPADGRLLGRRVRSPDRHQGLGRDDARRHRRAPSLALSRPQSRTCTRKSTRSCSPASARAIRSTTAFTWPAARCWPSWAAWPAYTGQTLTWDQCLNSTEDLTPASYEWGDVPLAPVAKPGLTRFV